MSNYSLEGAASQIVDNPDNTIFNTYTVTTTGTLGFGGNQLDVDDLHYLPPIDISTNYPEIKDKAFAHFFIKYWRMNSDTGVSILDINTSHYHNFLISTGQKYKYQIFYEQIKSDDNLNKHSANLFLPIVKHTDGKSYVHLYLDAQNNNARFKIDMFIRAGIG